MTLSQGEFEALASAGYNRIPVTVTTFCDLDTPLSIYLKLANKPWTYLLESVHGGERFGRYSFIGLASPSRIEVYGRTVLLLTGNRLVERRDYGDPLHYLNEYLNRIKIPPREGLPRFVGGLVGYFGFETIRLIEPRLAKSPHAKPDPLGTPDILLLVSEELAIVDNLTGQLTLVVYADPGVPGAYRRACCRLDELMGQLRQPVVWPTTSRLPTSSEAKVPSEPITFAFPQAAFEAAVARAQRYIVDGDIMQVVLSQRMTQPFTDQPLALYRAIRSLNPSPYLFYFDFETFHVVGASPEILCRVEDDGEAKKVIVRPIAGTRPRGATPAEDLALERELCADEKERSEHLQLLDLGRNDVGRVARTGSVKVTEAFAVERYSHVMHLVSNVEGVLREGETMLSVLRATFPAGTVSGAPKVRALEIIDELEPHGRGIYAGAVGYLGFHQEMDLAIAIRTAVVKEGQLHVQAGAGIVADSQPQAEWQETRNKALALLKAAASIRAGEFDQ